MKPRDIDERVLALTDTVIELDSRSLLRSRLSPVSAVEYESGSERQSDGD